MKLLSSFALVLVPNLVAPSIAASQGASSEHQQAALELLEVTNAEAMIDQSMQAFRQLFPLDSTQAERSAVLEEAINEILVEEFTWDKLEADLVSLYVELFSEAELRELSAFHRTELGQKMLARMPEFTRRSMEITQRRLQELMPRVQERIRVRRRPDDGPKA